MSFVSWELRSSSHEINIGESGILDELSGILELYFSYLRAGC